jgi:arylsulfatase
MAERPNILLVLVDDMGYSDLGCFGGEINTPNLDSLAAGGQAFTQFYNIARCCPTRASLMTGLYPHQAGIGHMTNPPTDRDGHDRKIFGYRGFLNHHCVTMGEVLRDAGYHTYLSGKWHLGQHEYDQHPIERGFDRYYGILAGASNYFKPGGPHRLSFNHDPIEPEGSSYYMTDAFTDYGMKFIREKKDDSPFFLYLAYNAPHWPLQAPQELVDKYRGKYMCGWDHIREQRLKKMIRLGIVKEDCFLSPRDPEVRAWDDLDETKKDEMDLRMAVYAAQIESMDYNIGRMIAFLKEQGHLDNTLIFFLSDNGACAEGGELGWGAKEQINQKDLGGLMVSYGRAWANASNTPHRMFKHYVQEGGIATPLIAHWPKGIKHNRLVREPGHLIDIMPTVLELSGASYPKKYHGNDIPPLEGASMCSFFKTGERNLDRYIFWEHEENCSVRHGRYKALHKYDTGSNWELYDLEDDPTELNNIAASFPDITTDMSKRWYDWADTHHVLPKRLEYR